MQAKGQSPSRVPASGGLTMCWGHPAHPLGLQTAPSPTLPGQVSAVLPVSCILLSTRNVTPGPREWPEPVLMMSELRGAGLWPEHWGS